MKGNFIGANLISKALRSLGVDTVFGVVGIPVVEIAEALRHDDIRFIACRNEQTAAYAACAYGYLNQRAGVLLVVSGPGLVHALSGMSYARENAWPLVVLAGSSELEQETRGAFQELNQVVAVQPFVKFAARPSSLTRNFAYVLSKAFRSAEYGRPGVAYIDIPANFITETVQESLLCSESMPCVIPPAPRAVPPSESLAEAASLLKQAARPLVIIGKGCSYCRAELEVREFIAKTRLPFVPMPMGKGVVPDSDVQCVAAARRIALETADVILLLGARLNWMLHFGAAPRFHKRVRIIQADIAAEELGNSIPVEQHTFLFGDLRNTVAALSKECDYSFHSTTLGHPNSAWWMQLLQASQKNQLKLLAKEQEFNIEFPLNYYNVYATIKKTLASFADDVLLVAEGANTMDIARTCFSHNNPRSRLDAGSAGTMGVGVGFSIAASVSNLTTGKKVVAIMGDSAFGFSGMDLETVARYNLKVLYVVMNNNGIYSGLSDKQYSRLDRFQRPSTSLTPNARYDLIAEAFGGRGYLVKNQEQLKQALEESLESSKLSLLNVIIRPNDGQSTDVVIPKL